MKKTYKVNVIIPSYVSKTIFVDDATSKTDARKKVQKEIRGHITYDMSADEEMGQYWHEAKVVSVEGGK
tara:strand:+ start:577 stop:783 length:207 start_codon:yes stop_codon:yes gene_type:complete